MDPQLWGPHLWYFLHTITFQYPIKPSWNDKKEMSDFLPLTLESLKFFPDTLGRLSFLSLSPFFNLIRSCPLVNICLTSFFRLLTVRLFRDYKQGVVKSNNQVAFRSQHSERGRMVIPARPGQASEKFRSGNPVG